MTVWSWSIGPWKAGASAIPALQLAGGPQADLATATSRSLKIRLIDPSEATIAVSGHSHEAAEFEEMVTDLWVYRDGVALFRGRMAPTDDDGDEKGHQVTAVSFDDYRGLLERRIRWLDRTWTNVEQSTIVWDAIADMQAEAGGDFGITKATWPASGVIRPSVTVKAGDTIWSLIKTMSLMDSGFDFDIDANLQATFYYPRRGADLGEGAILDYGGVIGRYRRHWDPDKYANAIRQSGADGVTATLFQSAAGIGSARQGRWEANYGDTQLTTTDMVAQTAAANLTRASLIQPSYSLTFVRGGWGGPSHVWVGDLVTVVIKHGRLFEQATAQVTELQIDVDASDVETVTATTGEVFVDESTVLRKLAKQVQQLTKR